ncbi:MAG: chromosomal replication initiator protein DnaA [Clostridia bacterium]|nr:chromosomal replication initiator protein DnaA [Clostridia bacterium]
MQYEKELWASVLNILEKEVTAVSFDLWIKTLEPVEIKNNEIVLVASSETAKNQCLKNHSTPIRLAVKEVYKNIDSFNILSPQEKDDHLKDVAILEERQEKEYSPLCNFNKKYTFDSFVVGNSNQFVYAASRSVAENPNNKYNPLFIYGGVGLGKTHLLHAIGNHLSLTKPDLKVLYVTCEQFTNDYIDTLGSNKKEKSLLSFREKYRNLDVLMIDDIQFIASKIETQEQFFHTFNDLYQNNKQVIIASDRHPRNIATLSDRLRSRFAMGLTQDIQKPDFETRMAILKKKAQEERYSVDDDVITYLAEKLNTNIREMEGALQKTYFYANLMGKQNASLNDAKEALKEVFESEAKAVNPENILEKVCRYFNVTEDDIIGKSKKKEIVEPRQVAVYIITELLDLPLTSIGKIFNGRDHTTIIHSRDKISDKIKTDNRLKIAVEDIKNMVLKK